MIRLRSRRGYTLIEVLIVVVVIGIASAVVVPGLIRASTLGIQAAARTAIADVLYAQNEAVVQQRPFTVYVDTDAERYWMETDADGDGVDEPVSLQWRVGGDSFIDFARDERFEGVSLARVELDASGNPTFTEDGGVVTIRFDELGSPDSRAQFGLLSDKQRFVIAVAEFTGRVTVQQH